MSWNLKHFPDLDFDITNFVPDIETFDWTFSEGHHGRKKGDAEVFKTVLVRIGEDSAKFMTIRDS